MAGTTAEPIDHGNGRGFTRQDLRYVGRKSIKKAGMTTKLRENHARS
jgi:hypothetical protein